MALSDEEVFGTAPAAAPAAPVGMSDADIWGAPKVEAVDPSFTGTLGRTAKRYADDAGEAVSKPFEMDKSAGPEWLQRVGDFGGRAGSVLGDTAGMVTSPVESGFSSGLGLIAQDQAKKYLGRDLTPEESAKIQKITDDTGQLLTAAVFAPTAAEKAGPLKVDPNMPVDNAILSVPDKVKSLVSEEASGSPLPNLKPILKDESSGLPGAALPPKEAVAPYESAKVHNSISEQYGKALQQSKQYYQDVRDIGGDIDVPVKGLSEQLDEVIGDINKDPLHEGRSSLSDLERIRERVGSGEKSGSILDSEGRPMRKQIPDMVSANDLLDIKQYLNEGFNPKRFSNRSDNPYAMLQKTVKQSLKEAGDMHPPFGEALDTADKFWVNGVDLPYRSNDVLHRFWKPEDYNGLRSMKEGRAETLPSSTLERQYKMLTKVKNPIEFESLFKALPEDARASFAQALRDNIKSDLGIGWGNRFKNIIKGTAHTVLPSSSNLGLGYHPVSGIKQVLRGIDPEIPDETADLLKATKGEKYNRGGPIKQVNTDPTPAQKMAGNYKKAHVKFHGLDISIENPKGSMRKGKGKDGKEWKSVMPDHYGYIKRTQGADDDHIDVYLGENDKSQRVYVIDQKDHETGKFDEHKCMLGYPSREAATAAYRAAFSDEKDRIMKITRLSIQEFKNWLKNGDTKQPIKKIA